MLFKSELRILLLNSGDPQSSLARFLNSDLQRSPKFTRANSGDQITKIYQSRPFSHSHVRFPIGRPSSHTIHKLSRAGFHFDETSVPVPQIPNQPRQANIQNLRYTSANQAPAKSNKSHMPAKWGVPSPPARTAMVMRAPSLTRAYSLARARPWSRVHLHGYVHICTAMAQASPTRPASGFGKSSANPVHSNALKLRNISADLRVQPAYSKRLGGMGMASTTTASLRRQGGQHACVIGLSGLKARLQSSLKA